MKLKKLIILTLSLITTVLFTYGNNHNPCEKCDINTVKLTEENINNLTFNIVKEFLCTFDKKCINNVEFSEWSNEVLFSVIIKDPNLFLQVLEKDKINFNLILSEIETPIHDLIDLQLAYNRVKGSTDDMKNKDTILNALEKAANNSNQKIAE